ncbi:uncharacterized protein LOC105201057 isoform X4 [Solenopsis invicta]|uniref:uncharacterized protein LOC105201057 isoform X4 n=1 Tax=Solenopsis invicta TaxID=13686 RepID=UPI00193D0E8F|nr:uncharacterized protein LOC105201057 isoform X4 [Solenopsis invicta]
MWTSDQEARRYDSSLFHVLSNCIEVIILAIIASSKDKKIAIGYQDWLQDKITGEEYLNVVKKKSEVKIKWPNCDVAPASIMKKRVKTCEWTIVVEKILSFGDQNVPATRQFGNIWSFRTK